MNLSQIRQGNLLNIDGGTMLRMKVERFFIDDQDRDCAILSTTTTLLERTFTCPVELLEGIPVTEELLQSLGFKWDFVTATYNFDGLGIIDNGEQGYYALLTPHDYLLTVPVPYLHTLQNLFFTIKGEELPVTQSHFDTPEQ